MSKAEIGTDPLSTCMTHPSPHAAFQREKRGWRRRPCSTGRKKRGERAHPPAQAPAQAPARETAQCLPRTPADRRCTGPCQREAGASVKNEVGALRTGRCPWARPTAHGTALAVLCHRANAAHVICVKNAAAPPHPGRAEPGAERRPARAPVNICKYKTPYHIEYTHKNV